MNGVKVIEIKKSIFDANEKAADALRRRLRERGVYLLNLMSSPGSGKTTTLIRLINLLKDKLNIAVMEADIDSDVDAVRIKGETGVESIQLHTGGMCHLDAEMTEQGLNGLFGFNEATPGSGSPDPQGIITDARLGSGSHADTAAPDLIILENVGNLVCPAEFDTGSCSNAMILSVPEGDDKPLKYPLMFSVCDTVIINKVDVLPYFDFDMDKCRENVRKRNPHARIIPVSARTGEGMEEVARWLLEEVEAWKSR